MENIITKSQVENLLFLNVNIVQDDLCLDDVFNKYGDYTFPTEKDLEKPNVLNSSMSISLY